MPRGLCVYQELMSIQPVLCVSVCICVCVCCSAGRKIFLHGPLGSRAVFIDIFLTRMPECFDMRKNSAVTFFLYLFCSVQQV